MYGDTAQIGSRVKHYGQRYTGCATATVTGFVRAGDTPNPMGYRDDWIKVLVDHDSDESAYAFKDGWDWDRTELRDPAALDEETS